MRLGRSAFCGGFGRVVVLKPFRQIVGDQLPFLLCRLGQGASGGRRGRVIRQHVDNLFGLAHGFGPFAVSRPVAPAPEWPQARSTDRRPQRARCGWRIGRHLLLADIGRNLRSARKQAIEIELPNRIIQITDPRGICTKTPATWPVRSLQLRNTWRPAVVARKSRCCLRTSSVSCALYACASGVRKGANDEFLLAATAQNLAKNI